MHDSDLGNVSDVDLGTTGGSVTSSPTGEYIGYYDGGLNFTLNYALSSPHAPDSSFTDTAATGMGSLSANGIDDYDPITGPYDPDSYLTFSISSVTSVADAPEPATWAMMLIGLGAIGGAFRARRREMTSRLSV